MLRFKLRTLVILLAVLPPFLAWWGWPAMKRILWPPKPALTVDFAFPIDQFDGELSLIVGSGQTMYEQPTGDE